MTQVLLCGAELSEAGQQIILRLSICWGGLKRRITMLQSILTWDIPISPKLELVPTG